MDKLWAPWRSKYIYLRKHKRCIFCGNNKKEFDRERYIIYRSRHCLAMLNLYPYNNGHVMVAPFKHAKSLKGLGDTELLDLMKTVKKITIALDKKLKPHGYNIGVNIGKASGAGFDKHVHIHIVPRWLGDTNFMPIITDSKVVSESLEAMYKLLKS